MADEPCPELGGLTPIEAADTPALDELACRGRNGLLATVPPGFAPGSEIAHLSLLGYNLPDVFEGRARSKPPVWVSILHLMRWLCVAI